MLEIWSCTGVSIGHMAVTLVCPSCGTAGTILDILKKSHWCSSGVSIEFCFMGVTVVFYWSFLCFTPFTLVLHGCCRAASMLVRKHCCDSSTET